MILFGGTSAYLWESARRKTVIDTYCETKAFFDTMGPALREFFNRHERFPISIDEVEGIVRGLEWPGRPRRTTSGQKLSDWFDYREPTFSPAKRQKEFASVLMYPRWTLTHDDYTPVVCLVSQPGARAQSLLYWVPIMVRSADLKSTLQRHDVGDRQGPRSRPTKAATSLAEENTRQAGISGQARSMLGDMIEVSDAEYASLTGLAQGSQQAQKRQRQAVQRFGLPLEVKTRKTGIVLRLIPAGAFTMGSPPSERKPANPRTILGDIEIYYMDESQHHVTLTKPFYCGKYEVTQAQWEQVMATNPSEFRDAGGDAPVEEVSWGDCQAFLKRLCQIEGVPEGTYRLPTEAEWEYACRGGTGTALYKGDLYVNGTCDPSALDAIAWYRDNSRWPGEHLQHGNGLTGTHPVGQKLPNAYGLYDMLGNVREWVEDWYDDHPTGRITDPSGPPWTKGYYGRFSRGGCWCSNAMDCRSATRTDSFFFELPGLSSDIVGFRLVRTILSSP